MTRIVPLVTRRAVVARFNGDVATRRSRAGGAWPREAAGQCRRTYDVEIDGPVAVGDVSPEDGRRGLLGRRRLARGARRRGRTRGRLGRGGVGARVAVASASARRVLRAETAGVVGRLAAGLPGGKLGIYPGRCEMSNDEGTR